MRLMRHRGVRTGLFAAALFVVVSAGCRWIDSFTEPELILWIRKARNDAGEPVEMLHFIKRTPAPLEILAGGIHGTTTGVVSGLVTLGEFYTARWIVNGRDIYVVDGMPIRSLVPADTVAVAGRHKGGSLLTKMIVLPGGRLRFIWLLCPTQSCESYYQPDEEFQGSAEFQGRLEATARYPIGD